MSSPTVAPRDDQAVGTHEAPHASPRKDRAPAEEPSPHCPGKIGRPDEDVFAIAFRGGGLDAVVDLGVIHAFLVSERRPPDAVVGSSAGSISAAALAEVLQEPTPERRVGRLRQFLAAYIEAPRDLTRVLLPDTNEVRAQTLLKSIDLPIYPKQERKERGEAVDTAFGLIRLINDLLCLRLRVSDLTRLVNLLFWWNRTGNVHTWWSRWGQRLALVFSLWAFAFATAWRVTPLTWRIIWAYAKPDHLSNPKGASVLIRSLYQWWVKLHRLIAHGIAGVLSYVLLLLLLAPLTLLLAPIALFIKWMSPYVAIPLSYVGSLLLSETAMSMWQMLQTHSLSVMVVSGIASVAWFALLMPLVLVGKYVMKRLRKVLLLAPMTFVIAVIASQWSSVAGSISYVVSVLVDEDVIPAWQVFETHSSTIIDVSGIVTLVWVALLVPLYLLRQQAMEWLRKTLLQQYRLKEELGSSYTLKQYLVRLFDRGYYGDSNISNTVERALAESNGGHGTPASDSPACLSGRKTLRDYSEPRPTMDNIVPPPIHVAPLVTNLCNGDAVPVAPDESVVDAIRGAVSVVPLFKPISLSILSNQDGKVVKNVPCVDATNVINEPLVTLIHYLRWRIHDGAKQIHLFPVAAFPTKGQLPPLGQHYDRLIDVVLRVLDLRRHQSASLEREFVNRYRDLLRPLKGANKVYVKSKPFLSADLIPIDTDTPLRMQEAWLSQETAAGKRDVMLQAIAAGCRSTLSVLAAPVLSPGCSVPVNCRTALETLLGKAPGLPGSDTKSGPGLSEVCRFCFWKDPRQEGDMKGTRHVDPEYRRVIPCPPAEARDWAVWPPRSASPPRHPDNTSTSNVKAEQPQPKHAQANGNGTDGAAPPANGSQTIDTSPWVVLLFSGGVFRGVFQVGVLNGLVQAGVNPRVFAGSSVGSIMAAMATRIFAGPNNPSAEVVGVAATFLGLDRLILTDRFADLVRRFTMRAGLTPVSMRDLDHVFRLYDMRATGAFGANVRRVLAGFERVLYQTPYDVERIVRAVREQHYAGVYQSLTNAIEDLLAGYGIGLELLGTDPMQTLIVGHVLGSSAKRSLTIKEHVESLKTPERHLLITATDLTTGSLRIIKKDEEGTPLLQALLASSAFPAVFRPRNAGEVFPQNHESAQLVDGGVMDNLPLGEVAHLLDQAAKDCQLARQPAVPHLLITGSLEPPYKELHPDRDRALLNELTSDWVPLMRRIKELRFNKKVDDFANAQDEMQALWKQSPESETQPVSIRVATVKPRWLCGTFAFHPMLGFRQYKQAESIAHGCAATLATLAWVPGKTEYQDHNVFKLKVDADAVKDWQKSGVLSPQPRKKPGACWFQTDDTPCPFASGEGLEGDAKKAAVRQIYDLCGKVETHLKKDQ